MVLGMVIEDEAVMIQNLCIVIMSSFDERQNLSKYATYIFSALLNSALR